MINSENLIQQEFIGLDTSVIDSSNLPLIGLNGTIINETKSMFTLKTAKGIKKIPKTNSIWSFKINNKELKLEGSKIQKRPLV